MGAHGLLSWLHAFNRGRAAADRVEVAGFDLQDPRGDVRSVLAYLHDLGEGREGGLDPALEAFARTRGALQTIAPTQVPALRERITALAASLDRRRAALVAASSADAFARHRYALDVARSGLALFDEPNEMTAYFRRDAHVADHVEWLRARCPSHALVIWAHNTHVARDNLEAEAFVTLGEQLSRRHGRAYYALGTAFFAGSVRAMYDGALRANDVGRPRTGSLEHFLLAVGSGQDFFVDLGDAARAPAWRAALHERSSLRGIGGAYQPERPERIYRPTQLGRMYDGLVFVRASTASMPLDP